MSLKAKNLASIDFYNRMTQKKQVVNCKGEVMSKLNILCQWGNAEGCLNMKNLKNKGIETICKK